MGKCAWLFPFDRRFFSVLCKSYHILAFIRQGLEKLKFTEMTRVHLTEEIRVEFETIWVLSEFLLADLRERNASNMYASDSSLEG